MTDRHMGYLVHLSADLREEDSARVLAAISMISGVSAISPVTGNLDTSVIPALRRDMEWKRRLDLLVAEMGRASG